MSIDAIAEVFDNVDMATGYLTITEAAERLGVSRQRVHQLIKQGRLEAEQVGHIWIIPESALDDIKKVPMGRPRKPSQ